MRVPQDDLPVFSVAFGQPITCLEDRLRALAVGEEDLDLGPNLCRSLARSDVN